MGKHAKRDIGEDNRGRAGCPIHQHGLGFLYLVGKHLALVEFKEQHCLKSEFSIANYRPNENKTSKNTNYRQYGHRSLNDG